MCQITTTVFLNDPVQEIEKCPGGELKDLSAWIGLWVEGQGVEGLQIGLPVEHRCW